MPSDSIEARIIGLLAEYFRITGQSLTLATVESASGGGIGDRVTNIPGSSQFFKGSVVSYSNEIKNRIVGVPEEILAAYGAVSPQAASAMAENGRRLFAADICVSDTGIAGPAGATTHKPVGLFYIGLSVAGSPAVVKKFSFRGSRLANKRSAVEAALGEVEQYLVQRVAAVSRLKLASRRVVTCFIRYRGRLLILRRSQKVGTYRGRWSAVSGYLERKPLRQAYTEIQEETGLAENDLRLIKTGNTVVIVDESLRTKWTVHPFLFAAKTVKKLRIDWENVESKWIRPQEIVKYDTVPGLAAVLNEVTGI